MIKIFVSCNFSSIYVILFYIVKADIILDPFPFLNKIYQSVIPTYLYPDVSSALDIFLLGTVFILVAVQIVTTKMFPSKHKYLPNWKQT